MTDDGCDSAGGFHPASALDYVPRPQLRDLQLSRFQSSLRRAYDCVAPYRKRMDERGVKPDDLKSLDDVLRLPFTEKADLRDTYPFGLFASPLREVVRLHASSGTTGKPIVVGYTREDVEVWSSVVLRSFVACGMRPGDVFQNTHGYGLFTGGLGAHYGAEALGVTVVPASAGNTDRQIMIMKDFGVTALISTPSYFIHLLERAAEIGVDMKELPLRTGIFGSEPWTEAMRRHIESRTRLKAHDLYGLSEIIGPGVAAECAQQSGLHIFEDHFYPEIVDPETGDPLPDGAEGELVFTTLSKRAMPMIRYRTHDLTSFITEPCACGRTIRRMHRIGRRTDDMLIIRGVNVFPSQIEAALLAVEGTLPHYQIILTRDKGLDEIEVQVEVTPEVFNDRIGTLEDLKSRLGHAIANTLGIRVKVHLAAPHALQRSEGKARRVIDKRNA